MASSKVNVFVCVAGSEDTVSGQRASKANARRALTA
ncbi:MAG: hypothetical protein ACI9ZM_000405 [Paracoccaceae bacterium]|jgi:hypothetical protein